MFCLFTHSNCNGRAYSHVHLHFENLTGLGCPVGLKALDGGMSFLPMVHREFLELMYVGEGIISRCRSRKQLR